MCYWNFWKSLYFRRKGSFSTFLGHFWTGFAILLLGTSNSEYMLTMWQFKNVFLEYLKKSIFWPKRVLLDFFWTFFTKVSSFCCWGQIHRNICSPYGNLRMCGIFDKVYLGCLFNLVLGHFLLQYFVFKDYLTYLTL